MDGVFLSIYDNIKLVSYAAAATAFDKSQNIFSGFLPMIENLLVLSDERLSISFLALQKLVDETYQVNIPKSTLRYLINLLEENGYVRFVDGRTIIPTKEKIIADIELFESNKCSIDDLFLAFQTHLSKTGQFISLPAVKSNVCQWIYLHSDDLSQFIIAGRLAEHFTEQSQTEEWEYSFAWTMFLLDCRTANIPLYNAFLQLFTGAVQASLLNFLPEKIQEIASPQRIIENALLDTNFVLRLLKLQAALDNETAIASWRLLNSNNVHFYVLEQTISESCQSIRNFLHEIDPYSQRVSRYMSKLQVHTTGFLSALEQGVSKTKMLELSEPNKMKSFLSSEYGITIIDDYDNEDISETDQESLIEFKNSVRYGAPQAKHDLQLIAYCNKKRPHRINSFCDANWWVLTNDKKLTFWNQTHTGVIQECITEVQLSNLMWLQSKKSNSDGLTNTIMALASKAGTTPAEISRFAACIEEYCESHKDSSQTLDKVYLVFANSTFTQQEMQQTIDCVDEFGSIIDKKISDIKLEQAQKDQAFNDSKTQNSELSQEILRLKQQSDQRELSYRKELIKREIDDLSKVIVISRENQQQIKKVQSFCSMQTASTGRLVTLFFLVPLVLTISVLFHFFHKPIFSWITTQIKTPGIMWSLLSVGILSIVSSAVYYIIITFIFGSPLQPKETFFKIRDWVLDKRKIKFIYKNRLDARYISTDLDFQFKEEKRIEEDSQKQLDKLKKDLNGLAA